MSSSSSKAPGPKPPAKESRDRERDKSKVHKLSLKGSARLVAEFVRGQGLSPPLPRLALALPLISVQFQYSIHTILCARFTSPTNPPRGLTCG